MKNEIYIHLCTVGSLIRRVCQVNHVHEYHVLELERRMSGDNLQLMTAQQMLIKHIQIHRDTLAQEFSGAPLLSGQIDWEGESPKFHELD